MANISLNVGATSVNASLMTPTNIKDGSVTTDKLADGAVTTEKLNEAVRGQISDLKNAVSYVVQNAETIFEQGFWSYSQGTAGSSDTYIRSKGSINEYYDVSIDPSYNIGIGILAYNGSTYIGAWNNSTGAWEKAAYKAVFSGTYYNIRNFETNYPSYSFRLTIRFLDGSEITPSVLSDKIIIHSFYDFSEMQTGLSKIDSLKAETDNAGITNWEETLSWNSIGVQTIYHDIKAGEPLDFVLTFSGTTSNGGQKNVQVYDDTSRIGIYYGNVSGKLTVPRNTESLRFVVSRTGTWTGWGVTVSIENNARTMLQRVYHVEKDGSGDFTKLTDAITAAEAYENSIVYVGDGTWDVLTELGSDYLNAIDSSDKTTWGLNLNNGIHLIFSSNSKVTANYTGTLANVKTYFSVFNSGDGGFALENCIIESSNIRYCVHDDPGIDTPYRNKYINCRMYHDNSGNTVFGGWQCIGGGFGKSGAIEIIGCYFDGRNQYNNTGGIVSYHNYSVANSKSRLTIRDCYFASAFTIRLSWFGTSTEISTLYACGNSLGAGIVHRAENESATVENTSVIEWNNVIRT